MLEKPSSCITVQMDGCKLYGPKCKILVHGITTSPLSAKRSSNRMNWGKDEIKIFLKHYDNILNLLLILSINLTNNLKKYELHSSRATIINIFIT